MGEEATQRPWEEGGKDWGWKEDRYDRGFGDTIPGLGDKLDMVVKEGVFRKDPQVLAWPYVGG